MFDTSFVWKFSCKRMEFVVKTDDSIFIKCAGFPGNYLGTPSISHIYNCLLPLFTKGEVGVRF